MISLCKYFNLHYSEEFAVKFSEEINLIYVNNNAIFLEEKKESM